MKYNIDYHNFRERNKERDIHNNAFNTSSYLSKAASIEKALKDGQRFETDKFYTKKKFVFREPQPLKSP
jgi:hypothetical protein